MKRAAFLLLASVSLGQQPQQNDFHFSKIVAISITAEGGLDSRLLSALSNRLRRIDGVIVNNVVNSPDCTIQIVALDPSNIPHIVAASYTVTSQVFERDRNPRLAACAEAILNAAFTKDTASELSKAAVFIDYSGVVTAGSENLDSLADQIASSVDAKVVQRARDFEFAVWKADQRQK